MEQKGNSRPVDDSLGRLAVKMRMLSEGDLETAREGAQKEGKSLEKVLLERGLLKERDVQVLLLALQTTGLDNPRPE